VVCTPVGPYYWSRQRVQPNLEASGRLVQGPGLTVSVQPRPRRSV